MSTIEEGQLIEVDPSVINADPKLNARFGLRQAKVTEMAEKILAQGQLQPIEVSPVTESNNGYEYNLTFGNYRLAAIKHLNKDGAGLPVKAIVRTTKPGVETTIRQLTENLSRQDNTSMDDAVSIKKLLDGGVDKMTVRAMFSREGRKGPVSNSWLNITLGFLDLPVKVQNKIQSGEIDWSGAAMLHKVNRDNKEKLPDVLKELEEARQKAIDKEEKEEEKFLATVKKAEDAAAKQTEAEAKQREVADAKVAKLKAAEEAILATEVINTNLVTSAQVALDEATEKVKSDPSEGAKAVADAAKKLEMVRKAAEKAKIQAAGDLAKLKERYAAEEKATREKAKEAAKEAKEAKKQATEAKEEKQPGGASKKGAADRATTGKDVAKAAAAAGAVGGVKLSAKEMREVVNFLMLPGGNGAAESKILKLGLMLDSCFNGTPFVGYPTGMTNNQLYKELLKLFGK